MNEYPENEQREEGEKPASSSGGDEHPGEGYRPSRSEFSDASYMPHDDAPRPPRTYSYTTASGPEREPGKRKRGSLGTGSIIALCLLCVLLGTVGGILATGGLRRGAAETTPPVQTVAPPAETVTPQIGTEYGHRLASDREIDEQLSATAIYENACRQVVGISTEVSYRTYYGVGTGTVTGTGFVVTEDGYILTNYHVVEAASKGNYPITVMFYNGDNYPATIVGYEDDGSDVAVLKINAEGLTPVTLGDSEQLQVGQTIFAVGNPLGELDYTMTRGMVSAMDREISTSGDDGTINMFQIDAAVNSGNSGGPVYNMEGEVIGIVTAKYSDTYEEMGIEGLGFAIPVNDAIAIANDLMENGYVRGKAYMGINTKSYSAATAEYYNWPMGAYVYAVVEGSCAESAGIQAGDIITAVNGNAVESVSDLQTVLKGYAAGQEAEITLYRSGSTLTVPIVFDEKQPEVTKTAQSSAGASRGEQYGYGGYFW